MAWRTPPQAAMWLSLMSTAAPEIVAMVVRTAHPHGVALERAQARGGLARVGDARRAALGDGLDVGPRLRRHAAHALHQIERHALAHQDGTRPTAHRPESRPGLRPGLLPRRAARRRSEASTRVKTRAKTGPPQATIGLRATARATAWAPAGMQASVVRSPDARSSSSAVAMTRSTTTRGSSRRHARPPGGSARSGGVKRSRTNRVRLGRWRDRP